MWGWSTQEFNVTAIELGLSSMQIAQTNVDSVEGTDTDEACTDGVDDDNDGGIGCI